jgi:CubicO group peptidase (beta-lactamase class C family)
MPNDAAKVRPLSAAHREAHLLEALVESGCRARLFPGAAFRVFRADGTILAGGVTGNAREEPVTPVRLDTVWDLASLTKPLATATSILILAQEGAFHLNEAVGKYLPECGPKVAPLSIRSLLTHSSGLKAWEKLHSQGLTRAQVVAKVKASIPEREPGTGYAYSDLGYILLGETVHAVSGRTIAQFAQERIFTPLGMTQTRYLPPKEWAARAAATRAEERKGVLTGVVHDGNCHAMGGVAGHAGLFGTLQDLQTFGQMILREGAIDRVRVLSPQTVRQMLRNQNAPPLNGHGLGWFMKPNGYLPAGDFLPDDTVGHTGFTGTSLLLSPSLGLGAILLTNRVLLEQDAGDFLTFRRRFHNAVAALAG